MPKESARNRILATAGRLFHMRGYSCVGINEIIEQSDTAKATFYHHFCSKQKLCKAWLDEVHQKSEESRRAILKAPGDPTDKVLAYFDSLGEFIVQSQYRGCPYTNTASVASEDESLLSDSIVRHKLSIRDFFQELAVRIDPDGPGARNLGDALFLLYSGATTEAQNLKELWPVEAAKEAARNLCQNTKL